MPTGIISSSPLTSFLYSCCHIHIILSLGPKPAFLNFKYSDILFTFVSQNFNINPKFQDMISKNSFQTENHL